MKQEDKDILLKDLCGRLPYGVRIKHKYGFTTLTDIDCYDLGEVTINTLAGDEDPNSYYLQDIKPYLFPLSSMTKEQYNHYMKYSASKAIDWCNKNHFDYRGLIEKGLAIDATGLNIY